MSTPTPEYGQYQPQQPYQTPQNQPQPHYPNPQNDHNQSPIAKTPFEFAKNISNPAARLTRAGFWWSLILYQVLANLIIMPLFNLAHFGLIATAIFILLLSSVIVMALIQRLNDTAYSSNLVIIYIAGLGLTFISTCMVNSSISTMMFYNNTINMSFTPRLLWPVFIYCIARIIMLIFTVTVGCFESQNRINYPNQNM